MTMERKKACLIWNPVAGNRKKNERDIHLIADFLTHQGYELLKKATEGPLTAGPIAKEVIATGIDQIFAVGGDGTINEVINGMNNTHAQLGIIPIGTANLLAREIHMPLNLKKALEALKTAEVRQVTLGKANDRYFILMAGIGFDGHVISKLRTHHKARFGKLAFVYEAMKQSFLYDYPYFKIKINNREIASTFAIIALSREYGSVFSLTPDAHIFREQFQLCIYKSHGAFAYWKYFFSALLKSHHLLKNVELDFADTIEIYSDKEIWSQIDGELFCKLPVKIQILPQALKLLIPKHH